MFKLWKEKLAGLSKLGLVFLILLAIYLPLRLFSPTNGLLGILTIAVCFTGAWWLIRSVRQGVRVAIWRLRNRLLVTYVFIGVVPALLILTLVALSSWMLASQIAVYLATAELGRKVEEMKNATDAVARTEPNLRQEVMRRVGDLNMDRSPGLHLWVRQGTVVNHWPAGAEMEPPDAAWGEASGVALHQGRYFAWSQRVRDGATIVAAVPLGKRFLSGMVPGLGEVYFLQVATPGMPKGEVSVGSRKFDFRPADQQVTGSLMPPSANRFDIGLGWISATPVSLWSEGNKQELALLMVRTRFSALLNILFSRKADELGGILPILLAAVAIAFLVVEIIALVIGTSLTRTITSAVHSLYEGTQRVMQGDFSHRIKVQGKDQLGDLGRSFNSMTENLERLVAVAKEKERLQAEIEIAREVQEQLYPKTVPSVRTLRVAGLCQPARMVSGDYYDFQRLHDNRLAIAMGDVAGKGISAALLMASIQSAMRMELRSSADNDGGPSRCLSAAHMVSELNQQLYATTSPEKYATFFFSLYDELTGVLHYTNAGHLPPMLFRKGGVELLDVNGTVLGAFPMSRYGESSVQMESGDLLVCYTDGVTEPENAYGEMFGEERLQELVAKNLDRDETRIMELIMDAVRQWTGSPELQDDMTVLLARKQ